jgi:hypothetical protein
LRDQVAVRSEWQYAHDVDDYVGRPDNNVAHDIDLFFDDDHDRARESLTSVLDLLAAAKRSGRHDVVF